MSQSWRAILGQSAELVYAMGNDKPYQADVGVVLASFVEDLH